MTVFRNASPAATHELGMYSRHITKLFLDKFGPSYTSAEEIHNSWRKIIPYSADAEDFLILKTRTYIRMLDPQDSNSRNLSYLKLLTKMMADYLTAYTHRNPAMANRNMARKRIEAALYDDFAYIKYLAAKQAAARALRQQRAEKYKEKRRMRQDAAKHFKQMKSVPGWVASSTLFNQR